LVRIELETEGFHRSRLSDLGQRVQQGIYLIPGRCQSIQRSSQANDLAVDLPQTIDDPRTLVYLLSTEIGIMGGEITGRHGSPSSLGRNRRRPSQHEIRR